MHTLPLRYAHKNNLARAGLLRVRDLPQVTVRFPNTTPRRQSSSAENGLAPRMQIAIASSGPLKASSRPFDEVREVEQERSFHAILFRRLHRPACDQAAAKQDESEFDAHYSCRRLSSRVSFARPQRQKDSSAPDHRNRVRRTGSQRRQPYGLVQQVVRIQEKGDSPRFASASASKDRSEHER
jgi:hypothetical protein